MCFYVGGRADLAEKSMLIGDLGDTIHVKLRKQHLDLRPYAQQLAEYSGTRVLFVTGLNKYNGAEFKTGLEVVFTYRLKLTRLTPLSRARLI